MQILLKSFLFGLSASLLFGACDGEIFGPGSGNPDTDPVVETELVGAGDRDLLEHWPTIDIPFSSNTKMLNFEQLRNEVKRATTLSWVEVEIDQWNSHRSILGGADFVETWQFDISPNQQKVLTIRRMAFTVCGDLVNGEAGEATRTVFSEVDPGQSIDVSLPAVEAQVRTLYKRFFFETISATTLSDSLTMLTDLQNQENQQEAWRGLCTAYLGSMRFLSI